MNFKDNIKKDFSLMAILLIPVAIAINVVGGQVASLLKLPIFLNTIGTILLSVLAGPWVGAIAGFLSNLLLGITDPTSIPFGIVSIATALVAGLLSRKNMFSTVWKSIISGIILGLTATIVAAPIIVYLFGGITAHGTSLVTAVFLAAGQNILQSVVTSNILSNLVDRVITGFIVYMVLKSLSSRYLAKFSYGKYYFHKEKNKNKNKHDYTFKSDENDINSEGNKNE